MSAPRAREWLDSTTPTRLSLSRRRRRLRVFPWFAARGGTPPRSPRSSGPTSPGTRASWPRGRRIPASRGPGGERGRFGRSDGEAGRAGRRRGRRRAGRDGAVSPSLVSPRRAPASRAHLRVLQERDGVLDHVVAHGLGSVGLRPGQVVRVVAHGARCNARRQISALRRQTIVIDERAIKYSSSVRASRGRTSLPGNLSSLSSSGLSSSGAAFPDAHRPPARRERVCPRCMRRPRRPRRR